MISLNSLEVPPMLLDVLTRRPYAALLCLLFATSIASSAPKTDDRLSPLGRIAQKKIKALTTVGAQFDTTCFNQPDCPEVAAAQGQAETSIAVDVTGQYIVIGYNDTRGFNVNPATQGVSVSGFFYSDD